MKRFCAHSRCHLPANHIIYVKIDLKIVYLCCGTCFEYLADRDNTELVRDWAKKARSLASFHGDQPPEAIAEMIGEWQAALQLREPPKLLTIVPPKIEPTVEDLLTFPSEFRLIIPDRCDVFTK